MKDAKALPGAGPFFLLGRPALSVDVRELSNHVNPVVCVPLIPLLVCCLLFAVCIVVVCSIECFHFAQSFFQSLMHVGITLQILQTFSCPCLDYYRSITLG